MSNTSARAVGLSGVPETMLWTLHNRASEASRPDAFLRDPDAVKIRDAISYDYERSFGKADGSHALRSKLFDEAVRPWLSAHPGGTVVELGAGLETQCLRCDDGKVRWVAVDMPEAIAVRERFMKPHERLRHVARSALDLQWLDEVGEAGAVFITAQGLFMYFDEADVRRLFAAIVGRFAGAEFMFDTIPRWFSRKTLQGFNKTRHYRAPPMPWGVNRSEIASTLRGFSPNLADITVVPYGFSRGIGGALLPVFSRVPGLREILPSVVRVRVKG